MHANMEITDQSYSNLNDGEVQNRIGSLGKSSTNQDDEIANLLREFLLWKKGKSS